MRLNKVIFFIIILLSNRLLSQENKDFILCDDKNTYPYYHPKLRYEGGFWEIKNHFKSKFNENKYHNVENNSGIVTIQFVVNCKGEIGKYETQSCDLNYYETEVNEDLVFDLLNLIKELNQWIVGKDENGTEVNSHAFLSFRIENGKITEILPK